MGEGERGSEVESPIKSMVVCLVLNRATRPLRCQNKASGSQLWVSEVVPECGLGTAGSFLSIAKGAAGFSEMLSGR